MSACPTCGHTTAIHYRDGSCPRWAGVRAVNRIGTRVCFRVGTRRWPEYNGHVLAYFADSVDVDTGMVLVWDVTAGAAESVPARTAQAEMGWTGRPSLSQVADAKADLEMEIGDRVVVVRSL